MTQNPSALQDPTKLRELIQRERRFGVVTLDLLRIPHPSEALEACNALVRHVGYRPPPMWVNLPVTAARLHLVRCLHRDLAHYVECMPKPRAEELADAFSSLFDEKSAQYFTNRLPWQPSVYERERQAKESGVVLIRDEEVVELGWGERGSGWAGTGLTESGFDTGIVVVDSDRAGLLWFEDED
jgi:hypothetical protein